MNRPQNERPLIRTTLKVDVNVNVRAVLFTLTMRADNKFDRVTE